MNNRHRANHRNPPLIERILEALEKNAAMSTSKLADSAGAEASQVFRACQKLEKRKELISGLSYSEHVLYFCPATGEVLTSENHDRIMAMLERARALGRPAGDDRLIPFHPRVRIWGLRKHAAQLRSLRKLKKVA